MVEKTAPRLIITDLAMPIMDGWELIARLKGSPDTAHIPVIALTAHAMLDDRQRAIAAGCNHFLVKPITPTTFVNDLLSVIADIPQLK
jgi:CheY-like chemotaxis protein